MSPNATAESSGNSKPLAAKASRIGSASVAGTGGFKVVSQGIAAALVATAAGLLVAIYAVVAYNYFVSKVNGLAMQYKLFTDEFLMALGESVGFGVAGPAGGAHGPRCEPG